MLCESHLQHNNTLEPKSPPRPDRIAFWMGVATLCLVLITGIFLHRTGVGGLDNDAYSYIGEAQWVLHKGFTGEVRPLTGNVPKPLLVLIYGVCWHIGQPGVLITILCAMIAGAVISLFVHIGALLCSRTAGIITAILGLVAFSTLEVALTANSGLFLLLFALLALHELLALEPGRRRVRRVLVALTFAGLSRPEGWILYLLATLFLLRNEVRSEKASRRYLALLLLCVPFLSPLLDRLLFGDWLYGIHSFQYFSTRFLGLMAPASWQGADWGRFGASLQGMLGNPISTFTLLFFACVGIWSLWKNSRTRLGFLLFPFSAILLFHAHTFRYGFFAPRFVVVPWAILVLLSGVGLAELAKALAIWRHKTRSYPFVKRLLPMTLSFAFCLLGGLCTMAFWARTRRGVEVMHIFNAYTTEIVLHCNAPNRDNLRILVDNAFYNPVQFHLSKPHTVLHRTLEEWNRETSLDQYDIICPGTRSPRLASLFAKIAQEGSRWQTYSYYPAQPLYIFVKRSTASAHVAFTKE